MHPAGPGLEIFEAPAPERAIDWEERVERRRFWRQVRAMVRAVRVEAARIAAKTTIANAANSAPTTPATLARVEVAQVPAHRDSFEAPAQDIATTLRDYCASAPELPLLEPEWSDDHWRYHVEPNGEERFIDTVSLPPPPAPIPEPSPLPVEVEWTDVQRSDDLPAPDLGVRPASYPALPKSDPPKAECLCMAVGCFAAVKPIVRAGGVLEFPKFCWLHATPSLLPPRKSTKPHPPARTSTRPSTPAATGSGRKANP